MTDSPDPLAPEKAQQFVALSHSDLDGVLELLGDSPALVNASWDWGGGDWETGLGAAAHMGRADIANALLDRGARMDVFAAAMLGKVSLVRSFLEDDPRLANALGPHGIPLVAHATAGGEAALDVLATIAAVREKGEVGVARLE